MKKGLGNKLVTSSKKSSRIDRSIVPFIEANLSAFSYAISAPLITIGSKTKLMYFTFF